MSAGNPGEHLPVESMENDDDLAVEHDESPPPEGEGPAASAEDFEPEDPDVEAIVDEE